MLNRPFARHRLRAAILLSPLVAGLAFAQVPPLPDPVGAQPSASTSAPPPLATPVPPPAAAPITPAPPAPHDPSAGQRPAAGTIHPHAPPPIDERPLEAAPPQGEQAPTIDRFRQVLAPHGRFIDTPEYGQVWMPGGVAPGWRPYTNGRWVYTRHGWTFVSADDWGWAPFHYGRWVYYPPSGGWAWIPGYQWAPAWVNWRFGGGYMSWAPLGPSNVAVAYYQTPSLWIAVRGRHFDRPLSRRYFVRTTYISRVFGVTRYAGVPRVGIYQSPPASYVAAVARRPIRQISASRVAPRWVASGTFRPARHLRSAFRNARVVMRPPHTVRRGPHGYKKGTRTDKVKRVRKTPGRVHRRRK